MNIDMVLLMRAFAPVGSSVKGFKPEITPIAAVPADFTRSLNAIADWARRYSKQGNPMQSSFVIEMPGSRSGAVNCEETATHVA